MHKATCRRRGSDYGFGARCREFRSCRAPLLRMLSPSGTTMAHAFTIIRNGHLVDLRQRRAAAADILIEGDTIRAIGSPGMDAPADAALVDASDRAHDAGIGQWPRPWPRHACQRSGRRSLAARVISQRHARHGRQSDARGQVSQRPCRRGRDDPQRLYRLLRPVLRIPAAEPRRRHRAWPSAIGMPVCAR